MLDQLAVSLYHLKGRLLSFTPKPNVKHVLTDAKIMHPFNGRPRLISCWNWAAISVRSVMVRPSFVMNTASGAYRAIIASIFPELNRSSSDGITPSGFVGSGKDSDIRDLPSCWLNCDAAMIRTFWYALCLLRRITKLVCSCVTPACDNFFKLAGLYRTSLEG